VSQNTIYNLKKISGIENNNGKKLKDDININTSYNSNVNVIKKQSEKLPKLTHFLHSPPNEIEVNKRLSNMRRLENMNQENIFEAKRKSLEEKVKEHKTEMKKLYHQLGVCKKELEELQLDIEFLENYRKYTGFDEKFNKVIGRKSSPSDLGQDFEKIMRLKKIIDVYFLYKIL
jgi:seryl-tRNA synthetase